MAGRLSEPLAMPDEDAALTRVMGLQDGLLTRRQALEVLAESQLRTRLATEWQVVLPGVYAGLRGELSRLQRKRAALLYGGPEAQLADITMLETIGVVDLPPTDAIHLLIPADQHRTSKAFVVVRRTHRPALPLVIGGLTYCPPERALADAATRLADLQTGRAIIADAIHRRLACEPLLAAELPHLAGAGAGTARRAIQDILGGARSAPECEFLDLCRSLRGVPVPLANSLLGLPDGRRISPDALWAEAGLIHETNSRRWHAEEDRFDSTQERAAAATAAGLILLSSSPRQIRSEQARIKRQVASLYRANAGRGLPPGVILLRAGPAD